MIDFKNKSVIKLKAVSIDDGHKFVDDLLIDNEYIIAAFSSMRDKLVFTDKRIISINVQGITGSKVDYTFIPYNKIQLFSIETAGMLDLDAEIDVVVSAIGTIRFELSSSSDIKKICKKISEKILD